MLQTVYMKAKAKEVERLLEEGDGLNDFTKFDPENSSDTIFQEFDPLPGSSGNMAWKLSRPVPWKSFLMCFKTVLVMQFLLGSSIGLISIAVVVLDFNTADLCYEKTFQWNSMPKIIQSIRVTGQSVEGFFIQLWHFFHNAVHVWVFRDERTQPFNVESPCCLHGRLLSPILYRYLASTNVPGCHTH